MSLRFRCFSTTVLAVAALTLGSCTSTESETQRHAEANSAAGKLGQAAHTVAVHTEKAAAVVGRKLDKAAHDAHEGWEESARKEKEKAR